MSGGQPAEEIAEDYRVSLEYLQTNDRYAINNLTVIAKENTEHADAISAVLVDHIKKTLPQQKLPALYVLDSIAKNIGTPYTLFLGHKLYNTFMGTYTLVDQTTRKKLDEMLKTWKNPVPGSTDMRPVFPPEITKRIENALIQARTAALQSQQRNQQAMLPRRVQTSTPLTQWQHAPSPQLNHQYPPMANQQYNQPHFVPNIDSVMTPQPYPNYHQAPTPQQMHPFQTQFPPSQMYQQLPIQVPDIGILRQDIDQLVVAGKQDYASNLADESRLVKLKALLELQTVLNTQHLPPHQLQAVRRQVNDLQAMQRQLHISPAPAPFAPHHLPHHYAIANSVLSTPLQPAQPQLPQPTTTDLAALLASVNRAKPRNPSLPLSSTASAVPSNLPHLPEPSQDTENPLLASLRAAGLLAGTVTPPINTNGNTSQQAGLSATNSQVSLSTLLQSVSATQKKAPLAAATTISRASAAALPPSLASLQALLKGNSAAPTKTETVPLTSASLKTPRPHLLSALFEARPNQCLTCGRRFTATEEGRAKKARHLDWHFNTNQRLVEASKRGQSRSWYVDELEWIRSRDSEEAVDAATDSFDNESRQTNGISARYDPDSYYVLVPADSVLASQPCPICQEKFEMSYNQEVQDWVWQDAIQVGNKIYHASCFGDLKRDGGNPPGGTSTPDSMLGKRKAEAGNGEVSPAKKAATER